MMALPVDIVTYGKWILAGEHSVLRGVPALVFPLKSKFLRLRASLESLPEGKIQYGGETGSEYEIFFRSVVAKLCEILNLDSKVIMSRQVFIESNLPVGTGLGASAAFCASICQLFSSWGFIKEQDLFSTAVQLENLFHGESSGVDLAVCFSGQGLLFERKGRRDVFRPQWFPHLYVSYTGQRGITFDCVSKVKAFMEGHPSLGDKVDEQMRSAVSLCEKALRGDSTSIQDLQNGMDLALDCFTQWGLVTSSVLTEMARLKKAGALAVKPTGSGGGGFVLSLWEEKPGHVPGLSSCFTEE
jgi:mevalonate kinase